MRHGFFLCALVGGFLGGCGPKLPPLGKVGGSVTYKGSPVTEGSVIFTDLAQGVAVVSDLDSEGHFACEVARGPGLPPGNYRVAIIPPGRPKPSLQYVAPDYDAGNKTYPHIPQKYRDEKTSDLTATVQSGDNPEFHFDMKD